MTFSWSKKLREVDEPEPEAVKAKPKKDDYFAEGAEEIAAAKIAKAEWQERCRQSLAKLVDSDKSPAWKITREPDGPFVIQQKSFKSRENVYSEVSVSDLFTYGREYILPAKHWETDSVDAYVHYDVLSDYRNPIRDGGIYKRYEPLRFHTLEQAQTYLKRLLNPGAEEAHYDDNGKRIPRKPKALEGGE